MEAFVTLPLRWFSLPFAPQPHPKTEPRSEFNFVPGEKIPGRPGEEGLKGPMYGQTLDGWRVRWVRMSWWTAASVSVQNWYHFLSLHFSII